MMRMPVAAIGTACLLLLGACDNQAAEQESTAPAQEENYQARMAALSPGQREMVLLNAIHEGGRDCDDAKTTTELAPIKGSPTWRITCDNGQKWIVIVGASGVAVVTTERELKANGVEVKPSGQSG